MTITEASEKLAAAMGEPLAAQDVGPQVVSTYLLPDRDANPQAGEQVEVNDRGNV
jgi:hypothetical protein